MRMFWYAGLLLLTGIVLFACQSGNTTIGQTVVNPSELQIQSVDSVTIKTSTVARADSFVTSGDAELVLGNWTDAQTGKLSARTYTSLDFLSNPLNGSTNVQFDSLVLELGYSFVYGDSTQAFNLNVYRLVSPLVIYSSSTDLAPVAKAYYNTSSVPYESKPFLQKTVIPQPRTLSRQVRMRVPDGVARTLYDRLVSGQITDNTTLNQFIPGFAIEGTSSTNTFVGFSDSPSSTTATSTGLRLYYHSTASAEVSTVSSSIQFPVQQLHFTQLTRDRSGTVLNALKNRGDAVPSTSTNNSTFVALGAGLQTRIEFPYLAQFSAPNQFADLNSALLVVGPIRRDFRDNYPPPTQLALYTTNAVNDLLTTVPAGSAGGSSASTSYTYDTNALTLSDYYAFDLTYYIGQIIKRRANTQPLILTLPVPAAGPYSLRQLVQRVALGDQYNPTDRLQLKLFLTSAGG